MKVCECGHPSSFHRDVGQKKAGFWDEFINGKDSSPVCSKKGCPCLRYTEK